MSEPQKQFHYHLISSNVLPDAYQTWQEEDSESASASIEAVSFTRQARRALTFAQVKANSFFHNYIDSFHLLLGLLEDEQDLPALIIARFGNVEQVKNFILTSISSGYEVIPGEMSLTPSYRNALRQAIEEARQSQQRPGSEHLLLGLAHNSSGISGKVFLQLGVNVDQIKEQIRQLSF